jgi:hypothetical protein
MPNNYSLKILAIIVLFNQVQSLNICDHPLFLTCVITQKEEYYYDEVLQIYTLRMKDVITSECVKNAQLV